jgi:hypothetical protein
MKANRLVAISIVLLALAGTASAQGVAWQDLTEAQRKLLAPHEQRWADLDPQRQQQIARGAERWLEMNRLRERYRGLTPEQRQSLRERRMRQPLPGGPGPGPGGPR